PIRAGGRRWGGKSLLAVTPPGCPNHGGGILCSRQRNRVTWSEDTMRDDLKWMLLVPMALLMTGVGILTVKGFKPAPSLPPTPVPAAVATTPLTQPPTAVSAKRQIQGLPPVGKEEPYPTLPMPTPEDMPLEDPKVRVSKGGTSTSTVATGGPST